jgi:uncharacterized protein DUF6289
MATQPRRNRRIWKMVGVLVLLALSLLAASPRTSSATGTYCETAFYSDATYTTIVGERIKNCDNSVYTWGTTSPYKITACEACGPS